MNKRQQSKLNHNTTSKPLHPKNIHRNGYNFPVLAKVHPLLNDYVKTNVHGNTSIDFANPLAVKALNTALLKQDYGLSHWDIPEGALCPPIPGRVDYIHYIAELLGVEEVRSAKNTKTPNISLLDIGTGANGIYSILASQTYGWHCVGSDINTQSLENFASIISKNKGLEKLLTLRLQHNKNHIFDGIILEGDFFNITVCNPPFHSSEAEALKGSIRKTSNLARNRSESVNESTATLNFGGLDAELWCKGGERLFLKKLIKESFTFSKQCQWFSTLVSKSDNVPLCKKLIRKLGATDIREIEMTQGNKTTRIIAWTFL